MQIVQEMTTGDTSGDKGKQVIFSFLSFTLLLLNKIVCSKSLRIKIETALPLPAKMEQPHVRDEQ